MRANQALRVARLQCVPIRADCGAPYRPPPRRRWPASEPVGFEATPVPRPRPRRALDGPNLPARVHPTSGAGSPRQQPYRLGRRSTGDQFRSPLHLARLVGHSERDRQPRSGWPGARASLPVPQALEAEGPVAQGSAMSTWLMFHAPSIAVARAATARCDVPHAPTAWVPRSVRHVRASRRCARAPPR